jgi:hypothetical protein
LKLVVMKKWILAALASLTALAAVGAITTATAAPGKKAGGGFNTVLAAKLGEQLDKPADDVQAAIKAANQGREKVAKPAPGSKPTAEQRKARREAAAKRRAAWNASVAKALDVDAQRVTDAVNALVEERLDSLVEDGWLTRAQADKRAARLGVNFLRVGAR